jgi:hypothetical protein
MDLTPMPSFGVYLVDKGWLFLVLVYPVSLRNLSPLLLLSAARPKIENKPPNTQYSVPND